MPLPNAQYKQLIRDFEQRHLDNLRTQNARYEDVTQKLPRIRDIDISISSLCVEQAKSLVNGGTFSEELLAGDIDVLCEEKRELLVREGFSPDYLDPIYSCPLCQDTGYIGDKRCQCLEAYIIDYLYERSNLRGVLEKENFSTLSLDYYSSNHIDPLSGRSSLDSIKIAVRTCKDFVRNFSEHSDNLLLCGDSGVGKTFLSNCVAKELIDNSYTVIYFSAVQFFDTLSREVFEKKSSPDTDDSSIIYHCDLLIIDDLGTELVNAFTSSQLFSCVNARISQGLSTVISTNLSLDEIKNIYSERIFSRLSSSYHILRITGDDIRIQKRLSNRRERT